MRKCLYLIFILSFLTLNNCSEKRIILGELHTTDLEKAKPYIWRELLKEYFLCECIREGFKDKDIQDISSAMYFDIVKYDIEAFHEVSEYARKYVISIDTSIIKDLGNNKPIILNCIGKYKSKDLDKFIKSMDKYMLNN